MIRVGGQGTQAHTPIEFRQGHSTRPLELHDAVTIEQILEIMPELADVSPWHTSTSRRTLDDVGRVARFTVSEEVFRTPTT